MARMKRAIEQPAASSTISGRMRDTGHPVLVRAADELDAGRSAEVSGYTLYRHLGADYLSVAHQFRVRVSPIGTVEPLNVIRRAR